VNASSLNTALARYRRGEIRNWQIDQAIDEYIDEMIAQDPEFARGLAANDLAEKARIDEARGTTLPPRAQQPARTPAGDATDGVLTDLIRKRFDLIASELRAMRAEAATPSLETAPTVELNVIGRDAANQIRSVAVKANDGRSYVLSVLGRDAGGNMSRLRLAPVAPAN
jgi:hypothetical protein